MLFFHAAILTCNRLPALIAEEVSVFVVAVAYLLLALVADMHKGRFVSTVDDPVTTITIVVFVIIYVIANEFSVTSGFIAISVVVIVEAQNTDPYAAIVAGVIAVPIVMVVSIGIFPTLGLLLANIAESVLVLVNVNNTSQLIAALIARPITVLVHANVRHPAAALITVMIAVIINMTLADLLHAVNGTVTILTSSVVIPVIAISAHPDTAIVTGMIPIIITVHIVKLVAPLNLFSAEIADSVFVLINVSGARHLIFTNVTEIVAVLVYTRNRIAALIAHAISIPVRAHLIKALIANAAVVCTAPYLRLTHIRQPNLAIIANVVVVIVRVIFSRYGAEGIICTQVTFSVPILVIAKVGKA